MMSTDLPGGTVPGIVGAPEIGMITDGGVVTETFEGEMTPATGFGGGEAILLTRGASLDGMTAENVLPKRIRTTGLERCVISASRCLALVT
jgi:hypothetical protein